MINDDEAHEALALLYDVQKLNGDIKSIHAEIQASTRSIAENIDKHIAAMEHREDLSRRLEVMELPYEQEMVLNSVLTMPPEALDVLREHLGIRARRKKAGAKQAK